MDFMQFWSGDFDVEVLLRVSEFVVNVWDNLAIFVFHEDLKNGSSLKLYSMVNFILGVSFGVNCVNR